ncbi:hypothetical protein FJD35_19255 [Pseudomonas mandelii]|nr:hypothetical protein FJD35_19255 [Pseudomonas mandelii]
MGNSDSKTGKSGGYPTPDIHLWRGSLLPLGCEAVAIRQTHSLRRKRVGGFGAASPASGSKLPRHRSIFTLILPVQRFGHSMQPETG